MSTENLFMSLAAITVPKEYLKDFDIVSVEEKASEWTITLHEKPDRVPAVLTGKAWALEGFCNPVNILSHGFSLKKIYLQSICRCTAEGGKSRAATGITATNTICTPKE